MIAIKRLQNILWIMIVAFGALTAYLISLRVATERNAVQALEQQIFRERSGIRYLETEFESRANMRQLEQWNSQDYRYVAPQAAQYLPGERSLASLDRVQSNGDSYVAPPVMMAMVDSDADLPSAATAATPSPAPQQIREDDVRLRIASAEIRAAPDRPITERPAKVDLASRATGPQASLRLTPALAPKARTPDVVARKAARMALLDEKLLDDRTLRDLGTKAVAEGGSRSMR